MQHHGLALLAESNTDYAHQLIHGTKSGIAATLPPFPMYVSRLRSEASPQVTANAAWAPGAAAPGAADGPDIARKEELVALTVVFVIRDTLARLGDNVLYAAAGIFLVFGSNMLFPFQARQQLLGFIWIDIGVGLAVVLTALLQVERDEVLSRIASTTPGQITWNRAMIARLAVYGLIPLLTLFAAQFPDIGATILQAVRPIEQWIP